MFGSYNKIIYIFTLVFIAAGLPLGILNIRITFLAIILGGLVFFDNYGANRIRNIDGWYVFMFMFLLPFYRMNYAITQPDNELIRYVSDYCNLTLLDFLIFLMFLRVLHFNTKYLKKDSCYILLLIFFGFNVLSIFQSINVSATIWTCIRCLKLIVIFVFFKSIFNFELDKKRLFSGAFISIIIQFLISVAQYIKKGPVGLSLFGEVRSLVIRDVVGSYSIRPSGTFEHPANMAFFSLFIFVLCLYEEKFSSQKRFIAMICALILIFFAGARTIMGLTALAIIVWTQNNGFKSKRGFSIIIIGIAGIFVLLFFTSAFESIINLFFHSDWSIQVSNRTTQWALLLSYIIKKPLLGYGANTYTDVTKSFVNSTIAPSMQFYLSNPCHNIYLQIWFDLGIGGLVAYILILVNGLRQYCNLVKKNKEVSALIVSSMVFVSTLIIFNFTGWSGLKDQVNYMLAMSLGLLFSVKGNIKNFN